MLTVPYALLSRSKVRRKAKGLHGSISTTPSQFRDGQIIQKEKTSI
jgi:hypothetical protein